MSKIYNTTTINSTEIAIALTDFTYGSNVKVIIPALLPLVDKTEPTDTVSYVSNSNIINKNKDELRTSKCIKSNYIDLYVPKELSPDSSLIGLSGQKFIVNFVGGDINKPFIYRRYD